MMITTRRFVSRTARRRGTVIALLALTIVALVAFLGLAIDLGMIALAKTQAQNAADLAALTAARTMNGDAGTTYNQSGATTNAITAANVRKVPRQPRCSSSKCVAGQPTVEANPPANVTKMICR